MNKKIISLLLISTIVSSTVLISCGKTNTSNETTNQETTNPGTTVTEENKENTNVADGESNSSSIIGENNAPTVEVKQLFTIVDFKDKDEKAIETLLGKPKEKNGDTYTYQKDNYTFEITYFNSKCGKIKIDPESEMKYPADGTNILKVLGINAGDADYISPAKLEWDNKFDTYKISVISNNEPDGKLEYVEIILAEEYNK